MTDALGWRKKFGVIGPSTNTIVQPDFDDMRVDGVTNHYRGIYTPNAEAVSNETFLAATEVIADNVLDAVRYVMTCEPDYLVMGMSAITFYGGIAGADRFEQQIIDASGLGISIGSHATRDALKAVGANRIAFLSPYFPAANEQVRRYFTECGFNVVRDTCLQCPRWTAIAEVQPEVLRKVVAKLDGDDVDAIVQVGTNLSMVRLAAELETELAKPVIAINTATYWHALRACGIEDRTPGFGSLLSEH